MPVGFVEAAAEYFFVTMDTNTKVSNLQQQAFSMTAIWEVSLD